MSSYAYASKLVSLTNLVFSIGFDDDFDEDDLA